MAEFKAFFAKVQALAGDSVGQRSGWLAHGRCNLGSNPDLGKPDLVKKLADAVTNKENDVYRRTTVNAHVHPCSFNSEKWCWNAGQTGEGRFNYDRTPFDTREQAIQDAMQIARTYPIVFKENHRRT